MRPIHPGQTIQRKSAHRLAARGIHHHAGRDLHPAVEGGPRHLHAQAARRGQHEHGAVWTQD